MPRVWSVERRARLSEKMRSKPAAIERWKTFKTNNPEWADAIEHAHARGKQPCDGCGSLSVRAVINKQTWEFVAWRCQACRNYDRKLAEDEALYGHLPLVLEEISGPLRVHA